MLRSGGVFDAAPNLLVVEPREGMTGREQRWVIERAQSWAL